MAFIDSYQDTFKEDSSSGRFEFRLGEALPQRIKEAGVPDSPGVYTYERPNGVEPTVMYIGKAGTWSQKKSGFKKQALCKRIRREHDSVSAQEFLNAKMKENKWKSIVIAWAVMTQGPKPRLPAKLEAELMQAFLEDYGNIPEWNKEF
jgi:hypothetical protein